MAQSVALKTLLARLTHPLLPYQTIAGLLLFAAVLAAYLLLDAALGFDPSRRQDPPPPWNRSDVRTAAVLALLCGYSLAAAGYARRGAERCMDDLRRVVCCSAEEHDTLKRAALAFFRQPPGLPAVVGTLTGVSVALYDVGETSGLVPAERWSPELLWWVPTLGILFGMVGQGVYAVFRVTRFFSWLGENLQTVDLFHVAALAPFARFGLRSALLWVVGTSIASLLFLEGRGTSALAATMICVPAMAFLALLLPMVGVRRRIQKAKMDELARVLDAIEQERLGLLASGPQPIRRNPAMMASLLAYREFIESVREWPLDASTLGRFLLYVTIGLGSWLGAAMVERFLESVLG